MSQLPYKATLRPFDGRTAYQHLKATMCCTQCYNALGETSQHIRIPSQEIDGVQYGAAGADVCSIACATAYLATYTPSISEYTQDSDTLPTQEQKEHWIYANRHEGKYPEHTERSGKWLIWLSPATIDRYWKAIREATYKGLLGQLCKASTAKSLSARSPYYVVCVYTYDYTDEADVMRIREELRRLGIRREIIYKRDVDTHFLRYGANYTPTYRA